MAPQKSRLLSPLPLEIRYQIFELLLCAPHTIMGFGPEIWLEESTTLIFSETNTRERVYSAINRGYPGPYCSFATILGQDLDEDLYLTEKLEKPGRVMDAENKRSPWTTIYHNRNGRGPLDSLSKSCPQLRQEITQWAPTERTDIISSPSFGLVHKRSTWFAFTFKNPGGSLFYSSKKPQNIAQAELFGLWKDVMSKLGDNDSQKIRERIYSRVLNRGFRERGLLREVHKQVKMGNERQLSLSRDCIELDQIWAGRSYYLWPMINLSKLDN